MENEIFDETIDNEVIDCDAEVMDDETEESGGSGIAGVAGLVGLGVAAGVAIHKWVAPAVGKGFRAIKSGIHKLTEDKKYIEVGGESEDKKSEDSEN